MNWGNLLDEAAIAALLPAEHAHFAKPVCEGLAVFLEGLPDKRQQEILAVQMSLKPSANVSERLGLLARSSPVLQKFGQILARDPRLSPILTQQLRQLESLSPCVSWKTIEEILHQEFGALDQLGVALRPPAIAEASVAVVVPFTTKHQSETRHGVFKILKPDIKEILEQELSLLELVGTYLDERCDELRIPHLDYKEAFQQVRIKLCEETCLQHEQQQIAAARDFYADDRRVQIPALFNFCTSRITAMERVWGDKVTSHRFTKSYERRQLAKLIVDAMVAQPIFSQRSRALFHSDPHAGNLFITTDGRLAILDWSLVGWLEKQERLAIVHLMLAAILQDEQRTTAIMGKLDKHGTLDIPKLRLIVRQKLQDLRRGQLPGLSWLVSLLDEAVRTAGLRLEANLMLFRKSLYTLEGVVADVGAGTGLFDHVLSKQFLQHLVAELPTRWMSLPNSRNFSTRLSNFDIAETVLSLPSSIVRFWLSQGCDWWEARLLNRKVARWS